ncbi:hypothetical protein JVU11DRAFT_12218 [Chiua virens]|nr:hypothetical protein JVU11DRAFT_12218 [Chiua virens]
MPSLMSFNIISISIIVSFSVIALGASEKVNKTTVGLSRYRSSTSPIKSTTSNDVPKAAHENRHNASFTKNITVAAARRNRNRSSPRDGSAQTNLLKMQTPTPTKRRRQNEEPTPEPTGGASTSTTVYIQGANMFALLLPQTSGEMVSDAEEDGVAYCTEGSGCGNPFPNGFIIGAAYSAADDGSYVQITGCMDTSTFPFASNDDGGQFDTRFPNGAQCTFGGYGASFIEL